MDSKLVDLNPDWSMYRLDSRLVDLDSTIVDLSSGLRTY